MFFRQRILDDLRAHDTIIYAILFLALTSVLSSGLKLANHPSPRIDEVNQNAQNIVLLLILLRVGDAIIYRNFRRP